MSREQLAQFLVNSMDGGIEHVAAPIRYRLGIVLVTLTMVMLPIVYLAFVALVAYGVYYHMIHHAGMLSVARGRAAILVLLAYLSPLIVGAILVLFMFKPILARPARIGRTRSLTRDGEPVLFSFIDALCDKIGAPRPQRIDVNCDANASASFRRGYLSMLTGNDLVLTIGMPLVAGMTMSELAGVMAHEFGHFSQGVGMRMSYMIRSISHWFTRVVYERDAWDEWLAGSTNDLDIRVAWVLILAQGGVFLTRRLLWILMMTGHIVSGFLLRQMEFDADRYEIRFAGSDAFESTSRRLREIGLAYQASQSDLRRFYQEGKLGDNLPKLIESRLEELTPEIRAKVREMGDESRTGWFDTHPADVERIASARREQAAGIFHVRRPASELFSNYESLCKNVTWDFFREYFGDRLKPADLHSVDGLLAQRKAEREERKTMDCYFQGAVSFWRPIRLPTGYLEPPREPQSTLKQLKTWRERVSQAGEAYRKQLAELEQADDDMVQAMCAVAVYRSHMPIRNLQFTIAAESIDEAKRIGRESQRRQAKAKENLQTHEDLAGRRMHAALQLALVPAVAQRLDQSPALVADVQQLLPLCQHLGTQMETIAEIRNHRSVLETLCSFLDRFGNDQTLVSEVLCESKNVARKMTQLHQSCSLLDYPFEHSTQGIKISSYLATYVPAPNEVGAVLDVSDEMIEKFAVLAMRISGRLAAIGEQVERALGWAPLPVWEDKPTVSSD
ncbi:MAG: M48 family metallopeptidase [Planctomycetales bacterium]|nr:M48 family metallopeptidase [Planctomycetales bacterium]